MIKFLRNMLIADCMVTVRRKSGGGGGSGLFTYNQALREAKRLFEQGHSDTVDIIHDGKVVWRNGREADDAK